MDPHQSQASSGARGAAALRLIGGYKLLKAVLLVALACGIFRLMRTDIARALEQWASALRLDPDSQYIHEAIARLAGVNRRYLQAIGFGTVLYALLSAIEGIGLWLRQRWAEYLTVIATASLLPLECVEILRRPTWPRFLALLGNLLILVYLIYRLKVDAPHRPARAPKA